MRFRVLPLLLLSVVLLSGCLIKPPAQVKFEVDRSVVQPGGTFHIIVTINNTGKVGIKDVYLWIDDERFVVVKSPSFPDVLKVGEAKKLVWMVRAPLVPGDYQLKVYLEITDELHRVWKGFTYETRIKVIGKPITSELSIYLDAPKEVQGGTEFKVGVTIVNGLGKLARITSVELIPGRFEVVESPKFPEFLETNSSVSLTYVLKAPYASLSERVLVVVEYLTAGESGRAVAEATFKSVWRPWEMSSEVLKTAYGNNSEWIWLDRVVDGYWEWVYRSDSSFNRTALREVVLPVVNEAESDVDAARALFNLILTKHTLDTNTTTLNPSDILERSSISPTEANILMVAYLRSLNIPARLVTLYDGFDCTRKAFVEFYASGRWYVVDFDTSFFGTREDFIASRWFPRIYQLITRNGYSLVAQRPKGAGHGHVDVAKEYVGNIEDVLLDVLSERLDREAFTRLTILVAEFSPEEKRFALFLFASAPPEEASTILKKHNPATLRGSVDALYKFYGDMDWAEDFRAYWEKFSSIYR
ncbi:transglutaminase domain-containing protein [Pyrococcus yayanosii]|uniref:Transglutaminase-like domain-containing protein n=1 Tax=Pyrococcus yayanosii (strain CH1 / JCM 16557) TaxID=529709 RepID=F8AIC5_PYRYC|nr:transglutaminase domain-containing protein [Pyrococcus yayanosii]AEH25528.1 hypothetical protein PYCH_18730 [Pyrococcus yayanosii CH1]